MSDDAFMEGQRREMNAVLDTFAALRRRTNSLRSRPSLIRGVLDGRPPGPAVLHLLQMVKLVSDVSGDTGKASIVIMLRDAADELEAPLLKR